MGGASFAAAFATSYGGRILSKRTAGVLFIVFVILGSVMLGKNVAITLGRNIVPSELITQKAIIIIFFTAGLSMFVANMMHIPQSTSLVTVAAIAGVGACFRQVNLNTLYYLIPFWIFLPVLSYFLTHYLTGFIYPPKKQNYWVYERFINHQEKLKKFVIAANCYNAFSVGTNNVANVVGPLIALGKFAFSPAFFIFACFYGLGAFVFRGSLKTAGDRIVPLGLLTASVISVISGTLMLVASMLGIPQSFVMLKMGAIFAVSSLKDGHESTFSNPLTQKTLYTWIINPTITFFMSYGLMWFFR